MGFAPAILFMAARFHQDSPVWAHGYRLCRTLANNYFDGVICGVRRLHWVGISGHGSGQESFRTDTPVGGFDQPVREVPQAQALLPSG